MSDKNYQNGELVLTDVNEAVVKCKMPQYGGIVNRGDIL